MKTKQLSAVLIRAFWLGMLLLALWANIFMLWGVRMYSSHAQWFNLSFHEFELIHYCGMAFMKIMLLVFFLVPYLGIKWARHSRKRK